jgi:hypothetical protein
MQHSHSGFTIGSQEVNSLVINLDPHQAASEPLSKSAKHKPKSPQLFVSAGLIPLPSK